MHFCVVTPGNPPGGDRLFPAGRRPRQVVRTVPLLGEGAPKPTLVFAVTVKV
jgi:hypothetical protein